MIGVHKKSNGIVIERHKNSTGIFEDHWFPDDKDQFREIRKMDELKNAEERRVFIGKKVVIPQKKLHLKLNGQLIVELPKELADLHKEMEESKYILKMRIDEDDESSGTYGVSTWIRAMRFLGDYAIWYLDQTERPIDIPAIYDGPDGSIDILWKKSDYRLLIKIPDPQRTEKASFYGDDYKSEEIKGTFNPEDFNKCMFLGLLT